MHPTIHRIPTPRGLRVVGLLLLAAELAGAVLLVVEVRGNPGLLISSLVPLLVGAVVSVLLLTCEIRVSVRREGATFAFWPLYRRVVCGCEVADVVVHERVAAARFGGLGLRRAPGGVTAMLWRSGPGVEVDLRDGSRIIVVLADGAALAAELRAMSCDRAA